MTYIYTCIVVADEISIGQKLTHICLDVCAPHSDSIYLTGIFYLNQDI